MKKVKKLTALLIAVLTLGLISLSALAAEGDYGSSAVEEGSTYTLEQMLTYAIQDEYLASSEYSKIIEAFGAQNPYSNIIKAEANHIAALTTLFEAYKLALPENNADDYTTVPASLLEAAKTGVTAEVNNIAMYEAFLKQELPDDVKAVFTSLMRASQSHLKAFQRSVDRLEGNLPTGGNTAAQGRGSVARGNVNGNGTVNPGSGTCDGSGVCGLTPQTGGRGNSGATGGRGAQQRNMDGTC